MDDLIARIETECPGMSWLVRSVDAGDDREHIGAPYFAHIHGPELTMTGYKPSYQGTGSSAIEALRMAFSKAARS